MLLASACDDLRYLRLVAEAWVKGNQDAAKKAKMGRYGRTWETVGAYNASCVTMTAEQCLRVRMRYAWRVYRSLMRRAMPVSGETARLASSAIVSSVSVR